MRVMRWLIDSFEETSFSYLSPASTGEWEGHRAQGVAREKDRVGHSPADLVAVAASWWALQGPHSAWVGAPPLRSAAELESKLDCRFSLAVPGQPLAATHPAASRCLVVALFEDAPLEAWAWAWASLVAEALIYRARADSSGWGPA